MKSNSKARLSLKKESLVKLSESQKQMVKGGNLAKDPTTVTCTAACPTNGTNTSLARGCCIPPCW